MRLIDADALRAAMYYEAFVTDSDMQKWDSGCWIRYKMFENKLDSAPIVDAEPVIRCCNCHWFSDRTKAVSTTPEGVDIGWCMCWIHDDIMPENGYCSKAERKDKDE